MRGSATPAMRSSVEPTTQVVMLTTLHVGIAPMRALRFEAEAAACSGLSDLARSAQPRQCGGAAAHLRAAAAHPRAAAAPPRAAAAHPRAAAAHPRAAAAHPRAAAAHPR